MEKGRNNTILLTIIGIATLLVALVGATFAYFTAISSGSDYTTSSLVIQSASGGTSVFTGGEEFIVNDIYPRGTTQTADTDFWAAKTVTLTFNNQNVLNDYNYYLVLNFNNSFADDEIYYTFTEVNNYCASDSSKVTQGTCSGTWATATTPSLTAYNSALNTSGTLDNTNNLVQQITLGKNTIAANSLSGGNSVTHAYVLRIAYPNDPNRNQNYGNSNNTQANIKNQEAQLSAYITIAEIPTANS